MSKMGLDKIAKGVEKADTEISVALLFTPVISLIIGYLIGKASSITLGIAAGLILFFVMYVLINIWAALTILWVARMHSILNDAQNRLNGVGP